MNINGPWCFIQDKDTISMEACDVCQSLGESRFQRIHSVYSPSLASRPTLPTDIANIDDVTIVGVDSGLFQHFRDEFHRYSAYLRERFMHIVQQMREKMRQFGSKISDRFNFNG
jgi:hypothetical protein